MSKPRQSKKAAAPRSAAKKEDKQTYEYTELAKASLTSGEAQHFYGVIIDATFPYKVNKQTYVCSLKVVDPSVHVKSAKGTGDSSDYATVVIYSNKFEDLPIVHRVGDIIRVHRAIVRIYKGQRQFNASVSNNSSWALFSTDKRTPTGQDSDDKAFSFLGKRYTFEKHDAQLLSQLRKWASQYFSNYPVITSDMATSLSKASSQKSDFDVVAKIVAIHQMDEYTNELKLADQSGASWFTLALRLKFPHLKVDDVVRIRSASFDETSTQKKVLNLQHYSNILTFISSSKLAQSVGSKVSDDKKTPNWHHARVVSEVDKKHAGLAHTSLHDLFHSADSDADIRDNTTFRTQFYVTRVEPASDSEWVKAFDKKSRKSSSLKGVSKPAGDLIWQVQLLVKDVSTEHNHNHYRVLVYSHEGLGANFFGKAANLHSDKAAAKRVAGHAETLTAFNSWVDAVVERRNGFYFIKDTKMVA